MHFLIVKRGALDDIGRTLLDDEIDTLEGVAAPTMEAIAGAFLKGGRPTYTRDAAAWFDMGLLSRLGRHRSDKLKRLNQPSRPQILRRLIGRIVEGSSTIRPDAAAALLGAASDSLGLNRGGKPVGLRAKQRMAPMSSESGSDPKSTAASTVPSITFEFDDYDLPGFMSIASCFGMEKFGYVATPNVDGLVRACEDASYLELYSRAAFLLLDSRVAALLFRLVHGIRVPVLPGSDLTAALLREVIKPGDRVVLIGSTAEQAQALRERFHLRDLLHHDPPMGFIRDSAAVEACLQFVEASSPFRFCLIAVGDPQGIIVAHRLAERGRARGMAFIIGASIDFITGKQHRAPRWMQRIALEWLFRLLTNPRRLAWRYLVRGPKILAYVGRSKIVLRPARPSSE